MGSEITHHDEIQNLISRITAEGEIYMKKKLILLLLAVLLLLTACSPGNSERGKELGYFNYPGLEWGMSETEFLKAAGASENDFTVETDDVALIKNTHWKTRSF